MHAMPIRFRSRQLEASWSGARTTKSWLKTNMTTCSVVSTPARFARCLANFQVDELLLLKKSVLMMEAMEDAPTTACPKAKSDGSQLPEQMALMAADRSEHDTTGSSGPWQSHPHAPASWPEEKPSKLQTIFQISITSLAFLSFGGYLLCLIVHAIKSKGTTYYHPVASTSSTSGNGNVKRIKVYRRGKRSSIRLRPSPAVLLQQDYVSYMNAVRERRRRMLT